MEGSCKLKARRGTNSNEPRSDDSSAILYYVNFVAPFALRFFFRSSVWIKEEISEQEFWLDDNLNISFTIDFFVVEFVA